MPVTEDEKRTVRDEVRRQLSLGAKSDWPHGRFPVLMQPSDEPDNLLHRPYWLDLEAVRSIVERWATEGNEVVFA